MAWAKRLLKTMQASQALLVRIMYGVHASIGVILAASFTNNYNLFYFEIFIIVSAIEYVVTVKKSKKGEWKWFLPSALIYICWLTPQIFIMEYKAKEIRLEILTNMSDTVSLKSCPVNLASMDVSIDVLDVTSDSSNSANTKQTHDMIRQLAILLQQSMMLVFIGGRWVGPKGAMTREQLSQLLLAYVGMAADMLEFITETLKIPEVACNNVLVTLVFVIWLWSLLQYTLGLTATKQRKTRVVGTASAQQDSCGMVHGFMSFLSCCCGGEIWALMVSVIMQDGPYLILRLYILLKLHDFGQIFFTVKNGILFCLQLYRISIVIGVVLKEKKENEIRENEIQADDPPYQLKEVKVNGDEKTNATHPDNGKNKDNNDAPSENEATNDKTEVNHSVDNNENGTSDISTST